MPQEYRYPLTRICLRSGSLTLPRTMLQLFPGEGNVTALDTKSDAEFEIEVTGPRSVEGFGAFFRQHHLDVNDELVIRELEDGRFAVTPVARVRRPDFTRPEVVVALLDELIDAGVAATAEEIRALYPDVPASFDLRSVLEADDRFVHHEGRWQARELVEERRAAAAVEEDVRIGDEAEVLVETEAPQRAQAAAPHEATHEVTPPSHAQAQANLWDAATPARAPVPPPSAPQESHDPGPELGARVHARRTAGPVFPGDAVPRATDEDVEIDIRHVGRAREALGEFGYRVEALGQGQLMAYAELGRRKYTALVQALGPGQRLDWAALLSRRRESGARFLAVFGDHRDLHRLRAPADLARATLWSWDGIERVRVLGRTVPVSPFDLEEHFDKGGLFEHGLERFEKTIAGRIAERGALSEVLARLAAMRAPTVFLLEELAGDTNLSRDEVLRLLGRLSEAPFHLIARVDSGEFCLRHRVADALGNLSDYALSLRERLPNRNRERLTGLADPSEFDLDDAATQVGAGGASHEHAEAPSGDEPPRR